jgi:ankyrin repeat protein
MKGHRTPEEMLEHLRKEAKRRFKAFQRGDDQAVRWFRGILPNGPAAPSLRDFQLAVARTLDFPGWAALKQAIETPLPAPTSREGIVNRFLDNACPDHHVRGKQDHRRAAATAMRLLTQHPWLARHDFNTAVVCGEMDFVRDAIARDTRVAVTASADPSVVRGMSGGENDLYEDLGAKGWTPLLYLCFARLPLAAANDNAVEIARMLLEAGADPNVFFHAGDSLYTPMTGLAGEGEEDRPPHSRRNEIAQLLLDHGANPYDIQVVYDLGFHSNYMWWLPMVHEASVKAGRAADWRDPEWRMLDMGGYGCGARWFLEHAISKRNVELAAWCLEHGASPDAAPSNSEHFARATLYEHAVRSGQHEIADLLLRHGARQTAVERKPMDELIDAAKRLDRERVEVLLREHPELRSEPRPLFVAAELNRADMVHLLIDAGFSPDVADDKNTRAMNHAAWSDSRDAAEALLARGAEVDPVERNYGGTPFGNASHFLHRRMMELLAPITKDVWNLTYNGYLDRLREVIEEKPERARVDWGEWSPLFWLPPHDEDVALETAKLFVKHGANPHQRADDGATPQSRAEALGMPRVAEYLSSLRPN